MERQSWPIALTIAGSDSGGGAGIQADLKTFAALQVHGTSAITCITAQNPAEVRAVQELPPSMVQQQIESIFAELPPTAIKTGMLFSSAIIEVVVERLRRAPRRIPLVVDPVFIATSGGRLLREDAVESLTKSLIPLAELITPNVPEAEALLEKSLPSQKDLEAAVRELSFRYGCATLLKGGHLPEQNVVIDYFHHHGATIKLRSTFIPGLKTHGTGCTLSAAIAALRAHGVPLPEAVSRGKQFITAAINQGYSAAKHFTLNPH